ncbi:MAG TPA: xyloglucanase [Candidatus Limnocylindrales bacterium]|nr:xyloglucanase [Candidatus Limnocylindrales bacterium]
MRSGKQLMLRAVALMLLCGPTMMEAQPPPAESYSWHNVAIGGGGFVTGIVFHPRQKGLIYARTDVGGAYRWDDTTQRWIPLTDWIGPADVNFTGIESLAVDPSDPNRVYLAAGTYTRGQAAILRSDDQGRTFQRAEVPFKMGANEIGRFNGERLAVDPNQGKILFFGSREDGLWRSADRGATWQKVAGFPNIQSGPDPADGPRRRSWFRQEPVGIVCVLFDPASSHPGSPAQQIYVAVSTAKTNLYRSTDGGITWQAVANQPVGLCPNHLVLSPDGLLYLSYGKEPGPNIMTDGAIRKFDPKNGVWSDITPVKPATADQTFGYGAVAVDAQHPATIMATTFCHWKPHDEVFRSTNGGATWTQLWNDDTEWDHSSAPYTKSRNPHWMGVIEINPFNPDQVLFTTGYGIWSCVNATAADSDQPTRWVFLDRGLEETVPLALISPPEGAHLLSGVGDIDGFQHDNLTDSPPETFAGPRFGNTEDLSFAWEKPQVMARTGTASGHDTGVCAAYSLDDGTTWTAFANNPADDPSAGSITISADGAIFVWTPRRNPPYYTVNYGTNWIACKGLATGSQVVADTVNPSRFYAFDSRTGKLLVSTNSAADFSISATTLPAVEGFGAGFGGSGGAGAVLYATPGYEGDLWIAFHANGLYHCAHGGMTFKKVEGAREANSLGFGKAAPGNKYPSLYLAGQADQLQAIFRSDDAGQTWVRINDDQHQFGWINHVTGDPRIYGRVYFGTAGRGIIYGDPVPNTK